MGRKTRCLPRWRGLTAAMRPLLVACTLWATWALADAAACSIPVFRYALERWSADWYELDVFYRGELSAEERSLLDSLEDVSTANGGQANLEVVRVNLDGQVDQDLLDLWKSLGDVPTPFAVLRMPPGGMRMVVSSGPLNELDQRALLDSPARRELTRRLLAGHSVVWLVVGPQDAEATSDARRVLRESLPKLQEEIPLPGGVGLPGSELASPIPLAVKFSTIEIDSADPAESWLVRILASQAPKTSKLGEPLVAAVFGRGRAVEVFTAQEITPELLTDVSQFLCGACSCQVKQLNPGFDLLFSTSWEEALFDPDSVPAAAALAEAEAAPVMVPIPKGPPQPNAGQADNVHDRAAASDTSVRTSPWGQWIPWSIVAVGLAAVLFVTLARWSGK